MKFAVASTAYDAMFSSGEINLFDWLTICAAELKAGGAAIHLRHIEQTDEESISETRRMMADLQLTPVAIYMDTDFGQPDQESRDRELERVEVGLRAAREIGAPCLRIQAGERRGGPEESFRELVRCCSIAAMLAEREGVVLAVQNQPGKERFLTTSEGVESLIAAAETDWLRLNLDTGGFSDGFQSIEKTVLFCVNLNLQLSRAFDERQPGGVETKDIFELLKQVGYRGFVTLDYTGEEKPDAIVPELARRVRESIFKA